jgi:hypothetical protein
MKNSVSIKRRCGGPEILCAMAVALIVWTLALCGPLSAAGEQQKVFTSPEEAVKAFLGAAKTGNNAQLTAILGPGSGGIISSGDKVADREMRDLFVKSFEDGHNLETKGENKVLLRVGNSDWPFPLPIVKEGQSWRFDSAEGATEILNRRIGRNELSAIQVCLAYVDAQREYALMERDKGGLLAYARKFVSDPGKKNGLFWKTGDGEPESPIGPLAAYAASEGYRLKTARKKPLPYHGYFFRIIDGQGSHAPGGAYNYLAGDKMIGGFALVAYPARYGISGVMSFMVNQAGIVYQKDLGKNTAGIASKMTVFDPDATWVKTE